VISQNKINTLVPNYTVLDTKRESFLHSSSGRHYKSLTMKNSKFSQRSIFKLRAWILRHLINLETDVSVYRNWNLEMKAKFSP